MDTRKTVRLLLLVALLTAFSLAAYVFFFLRIAEKNRMVSLLANDVDLITQKESKLRSIQSLVKDTEEERALLDDYFVSEEGVVGFIETIESFGAVAGTEIEVTSVEKGPLDASAKEAEPQVFELLRIGFKTSGSWRGVMHVLALLETLPYRVSITRATVEAVAAVDEEEPPAWNGFFTVTVVIAKMK